MQCPLAESVEGDSVCAFAYVCVCVLKRITKFESATSHLWMEGNVVRLRPKINK